MQTIAIPAYNEEARLGPTLKLLSKWVTSQKSGYRVLVLCDGTDGTYKLASDFSQEQPVIFRAVSFPKRLGKGGAIQKAMQLAYAGPLFQYDADASMPPEEMPAMLAKLESSKADIVIGSRRLPASKVSGLPSWRLHLGGLMNSMVRSLFSMEYADTQCGYKLYSQKAVQALKDYKFQSCGYEWDVEMLIVAKKLGLSVLEVPVHWDYRDNGKARPMDLLGMMLGMIRLWKKYRK